MANDKHETALDREHGARDLGHRELAKDIADEYERTTGHPMGGSSATKPGNEMPTDMPASTDPEHEQHTRKGQAESPRELTHNQPEKKRQADR